jgi:hypothetical protein
MVNDENAVRRAKFLGLEVLKTGSKTTAVFWVVVP